MLLLVMLKALHDATVKFHKVGTVTKGWGAALTGPLGLLGLLGNSAPVYGAAVSSSRLGKRRKIRTLHGHLPRRITRFRNDCSNPTLGVPRLATTVSTKKPGRNGKPQMWHDSPRALQVIQKGRDVGPSYFMTQGP